MLILLLLLATIAVDAAMFRRAGCYGWIAHSGFGVAGQAGSGTQAIPRPPRSMV